MSLGKCGETCQVSVGERCWVRCRMRGVREVWKSV